MIHNFSWVIPGKLAGCAMPHSFSDLQELYNRGVRCLVSLHCDADLSQACKRAGLLWICYQIDDFSVPSDMVQFDHIISQIIKLIRKDVPVCVHCGAGVGRTGMVLACVVGIESRLDYAEAIDYVRGKRTAIDTKEQEKYVYSYLSRYSSHL